LSVSNSIGSLRALDIVVVGFVAGPLVTGLYSAASRIVAPATVVAGAASSVLMPGSAVMSAPAARKLIRRILAIALIAGISIIPLALVSEAMMGIIFGHDYASGGGDIGLAVD
jgi:O-antigen/teichoic acid export membrane protein